MSPNLEGGLVGCLSMVHHIVPYLISDSTLMNELSDSLLARILFPALHIATSKCLAFASGSTSRRVILTKLLDIVYLIGLRIGEEMARAHLTPLCSAFFSAFDKVYDPEGVRLSQVKDELALVLAPELAYDGYVAFHHLVGRGHLDASLPNLDLIKMLCEPFDETDAIRPANFAHFRHQSSFEKDSSDDVGSSGNKIGSSGSTACQR